VSGREIRMISKYWGTYQVTNQFSHSEGAKNNAKKRRAGKALKEFEMSG